MNGDNKASALEAIDAAISVHRAIRATIEEVIARRLFRRRNVDKERSLKASIIQRLSRLRMRRLHVEAAQVIVTAPTVQEIESTLALINDIEAQAVADAGRVATLKFLSDARNTAASLQSKVVV